MGRFIYWTGEETGMDDRPGLLLTMMDVAAADEDEFNRWYDEEHLAERLGLPGFRTAQRYVAAGEAVPKYMNLYDLESVGALQTPEYRHAFGPGRTPWTARMLGQVVINFSRNVLEQSFALDGSTPAGKVGAVLLVSLDFPAAPEGEFDDWYNTEHLPYLCALPGVIRARRFVAREKQPEDLLGKYLAIYDLTGPEPIQAPSWAASLDSPWSKRIVRHWTRRFRNLYRTYGV